MIIEILNRTFIAITGGKAIPQFLVEEGSLEKYAAQKTDKKKGIDKMPNERTQVVSNIWKLLTKELIFYSIQENVSSGDQNQKQKHTLYSKNKGEFFLK